MPPRSERVEPIMDIHHPATFRPLSHHCTFPAAAIKGIAHALPAIACSVAGSLFKQGKPLDSSSPVGHCVHFLDLLVLDFDRAGEDELPHPADDDQNEKDDG